ncbi:nSTAND1 domain-containing NTPase [Nocardioides sp. MAHUQ-72]|uniref:nSTAND1 domain-containing NTPase n=1 Tax=unclassified Nocardioides TaxID=2615069 RepID=UPI00361D3B6C
MGIAVLGPLEVDGAALGARDRVVLAALAMAPRQALGAEQLADALWGAAPPPSWRKNLQSCVVRLRRVLGPDAIVTTPQGYRLAVPHDDVDADVFERLAARGRELLTLGEDERAVYSLARALALWRGRPFSELEEWEPGRTEAGRLGELRLGAEEDWLDASLRSGHHAEVLSRAQAMVRDAPLRERRWQLLALAEYRCGRQGEALGTVQELRRMLARELGLDPDPATLALEEAILRQDPALVVAPAPAVTDHSPYLGLSAYDVADAEAFFGRDRDLAACLQRLHETGVLAVVGPSGSGKSSLVRAGVAAALRAGGHPVEVVTPGARPLDCWPSVQPGPRPTVVVVDQCEEVFTLCREPAARTAFLDLLVTHAAARDGPRLVVALRADRMGDLAGQPAFGRLVEQGLHLLGAMDEDGLRAAIEGPARQAGLVLEPGLVDLLLREVEGEPAALPLLSHTLRETWVRREGRSLTVAGYRASGGIRQAVARTAEDVYERLDERQRGMLRELMQRLVAPGPEGQPVLSRVPRRLLGGDPTQQAIVETLVGARILTSDEDSVALTHEAIVRAWPRLGRWLDEDLEGRRILHHLAAAAQEWDRLGRPVSELYRGARLQGALDWQRSARPELARSEREFLDAGRELAEVEERSASRRAHEQARMIRRLRVVLAGAVGLLLVALVATVFAVHQGRVADRSASAATLAGTAAVARAAGAAALVTDDIDESLLLAVAGVRLDDSVASRRSLQATIARFPRLWSSTPMPGEEQVLGVDVAARGGLVATMDYLQTVRVYDGSSGRLVASRQVGQPNGVGIERDRLVEFAPDGRSLAVVATGGGDPAVLLLDAHTLRPVAGLAAPRGRGWVGTDLAFSADGSHLAAAVRRVQVVREDPSTGSVAAVAAAALVWDLRQGGPPVRVPLRDPEWQSVALSPDGTRLYSTGPLTVHDLRNGSHRVLDDRVVGPLEMGRGGRTLVTTSWNGPVVEDLRTGRSTRIDTDLDVADVRLSRDARTLLLVQWGDRKAEVWRLDGSKVDGPRVTLDLDRGMARAVDLAADGTYVYSTSGSTALRRWDLTGRRELVRRVRLPLRREQGAFSVVSPDGRREIFAAAGRYSFGFRDLRTGEETRLIPWGAGYRHTIGAWHPDGRHYASAVGDRLSIWDMRTGRLAESARLPGDRVSEIDFSPDGTRLAVAEVSGRVTMLSTRTWEPVGRQVEVGDKVSWVQAVPDDRTVVVLTGGPGTQQLRIAPSPGWAVLDLEAGTVRSRGDLGMAHGSWLDVSPDGRYAAVAGGTFAERIDATGADGVLAVLDLRAGRLVRPPVIAHQGAAFQLAYSPDGTRILTTGLDGTVALWDAARGTSLGRVELDGRPYTAAAFTDDGHEARIVEWWSGRVWTWPLDTDAALVHACRAAGRDLTLEEWRDHFGGLPYQRVCAA